MNFLIGCCEKQPIRKLGKRLRSYEKENRSLIPAGDKVWGIGLEGPQRPQFSLSRFLITVFSPTKITLLSLKSKRANSNLWHTLNKHKLIG